MIICEKSARAESYSWLKQLCQENGYTIIEVSRETQERFEREHGHPVAFDILHKGDIRTLFIHETATNASIISCIEHCFGVRQWCVKRLAN